MISKFLAVTVALAAAHVANAVDPYVLTRSTTTVTREGQNYYRQEFRLKLSDPSQERVIGLGSISTDFTASSFGPNYAATNYPASWPAAAKRSDFNPFVGGTNDPFQVEIAGLAGISSANGFYGSEYVSGLLFSALDGGSQKAGPIGTYFAPGIESYSDYQAVFGCTISAAINNDWPTNVADWGSGADFDAAFSYSTSGTGCGDLGQDTGNGVILAVIESENPVEDFVFKVIIHNTADAYNDASNPNKRLLSIEATGANSLSTDTTGPMADHVCVDKVYDGLGMDASIYASPLAAYDSSSGACSTYTPPAGLQKGCDDVWSLTPTEEDACRVCGGDNSTCTGCKDETACNYDVTVTIEDQASCDFASCVGCDGVTYLPHVDGPIPQAGLNDTCGVCGGNGTSCVQPCSFHAPGTLFPADLIYITENSNGDSTDDSIKLTFNWNSGQEASQTNYYFLTAKSSGSAFDGDLGASIQPDTLLNGNGVLAHFDPVGFPDFNLNSSDPGNVASSTSTGTGSVTHTINADGSTSEFIYEGPDQDVLIMIGAASSCLTSRSDVEYVYIRSVYKFRVKERLSMEKTVDADGFLSYVARYGNDVQGQEPLLVTQQDLTQNLQTMTAQHVMKTRNLEVHSNLEGPAGHDCLGANTDAEADYTESNADSTISVTNNNGAVTCTITATGDISNYVQTTDNRDTVNGYNDTDIDQATDDAGEGNVAFSDFYIALALSQYTQMNQVSDYVVGNTWSDIDAEWDVTTSDATGLWGKLDGNDVRTDLCRLKRHNVGGSGTDITEKSANTLISLNAHEVTTPHQPAEQDGTGVAVNDATRQGTYALNDEAHVKCSFSPFQLTADTAGKDGARYSPLVYVRAWFDYGKGELQSDYARRLRSSKQLTSGMRKNTVHYMHIRLARSN